MEALKFSETRSLPGPFIPYSYSTFPSITASECIVEGISPSWHPRPRLSCWKPGKVSTSSRPNILRYLRSQNLWNESASVHLVPVLLGASNLKLGQLLQDVQQISHIQNMFEQPVDEANEVEANMGPQLLILLSPSGPSITKSCDRKVSIIQIIPCRPISSSSISIWRISTLWRTGVTPANTASYSSRPSTSIFNRCILPEHVHCWQCWLVGKETQLIGSSKVW